MKDDFLEFPITSIDYTLDGNYLLVSSPKFPKIYWINQNKTQSIPTDQFQNQWLNSKMNKIGNFLKDVKHDLLYQRQFENTETNLNEDKSFRMFFKTITYFSLSPDNTRICVGSTESGLRVYETMNFSYKVFLKFIHLNSLLIYYFFSPKIELG